MNIKTLLITIIFILNFSVVNAQSVKLVSKVDDFEKVELDGARERRFYSENVKQEYKLYINLPRNYQDSDTHYPVVYLLDAQWDYPMLVSLYGPLNYDGDVPDLILVGVTWGGDESTPHQNRLRDFTPTAVPGANGSGGAPAFLSFLKNEP